MDVKFPDPLGRRRKLSNISYLTLIVLVKRADHYSDTVRTSDFFWGGGRDKMPQCANLRFDESQPYTSHHNQLIIHDEKDDLHHSIYIHAHTILVVLHTQAPIIIIGTKRQLFIFLSWWFRVHLTLFVASDFFLSYIKTANMDKRNPYMYLRHNQQLDLRERELALQLQQEQQSINKQHESDKRTCNKLNENLRNLLTQYDTLSLSSDSIRAILPKLTKETVSQIYNEIYNTTYKQVSENTTTLTAIAFSNCLLEYNPTAGSVKLTSNVLIQLVNLLSNGTRTRLQKEILKDVRFIYNN